MAQEAIRKLNKIIKNIPNLFSGYNIYVSRGKLRLIDRAFAGIHPKPTSFADLGGVWKVNAAYTRYALKNHTISRGIIADTNYNKVVEKRLSPFSNLEKLSGNFGNDDICKKIGKVDMVFLFDVLLHQVTPDWNEVLGKYAKITDNFVIYNQQIISAEKTFRLTKLPLEEYKKYAPHKTDGMYEHIFSHANEMNEEYNRPWIDVHNIWQWGITDSDLRAEMKKLGFKEIYFNNYGRFSNLVHFEDHGFIFTRK